MNASDIANSNTDTTIMDAFNNACKDWLILLMKIIGR